MSHKHYLCVSTNWNSKQEAFVQPQIQTSEEVILVGYKEFLEDLAIGHPQPTIFPDLTDTNIFMELLLEIKSMHSPHH